MPETIISESPVKAKRNFTLMQTTSLGNRTKEFYLGPIAKGPSLVYEAATAYSHETPTPDNKAGIYAFTLEHAKWHYSIYSRHVISADVDLSGVVIEHTNGILRAQKMSIKKLYLPPTCAHRRPTTAIAVKYDWSMLRYDMDESSVLVGKGMAYINDDLLLKLEGYNRVCRRCKQGVYIPDDIYSVQEVAAALTQKYNVPVYWHNVVMRWDEN